MGKYFGTDGFRGEAGITLTSDHAYKVGRFLGWYYNALRERNGDSNPARIVIGKDTRRSSYMFEYSLVAGLTASGADAYLLHVTTTPSVAYIARVDDFDCGIMISASHNPFYDNGMKSKVKRKKVYFITVVVGFAICMVGVIFGSRLVFQRTCERRTTPWSDLGTADDDEYRILIDAYKIKNQSNETVMIQAFDNTKLIGHYYEREKGAPLIVFFHGLWGHSYLDGVPIYRITQKHNWNLLLCDLRAQGDSEGEFSTLGVLEKYDCLDWVEWAQNRFGDKNPIFLMGVSMGASIVMMSSDLELPDSVYGIIDDCGFTSTLDVIKQNNNKQISKYIPKNLVPTMLNVGTKIWGSFDLSDADACKALAHTDIPLLIIHGDEDMKAPLSMAYKLYDSCNGEKQLYIVHGADHTENYRKDPGGYEKIVTKFIEERIRQKKCQTPGTKP